jgi:uncharacterized protein
MLVLQSRRFGAVTKTIDYGNLMHRAMRGLIQEVLTGVAKTGLPGQHHFFITFDTMHPDVEIAGEMTIVLQHWFDKLDVTDEGFAVTLNFGDNPEPLYVPYDSIKTFVDPSVEFGLRFETQDDSEAEEADEAPMDEMAEPVVAPKPAAQVVSLDAFRK